MLKVTINSLAKHHGWTYNKLQKTLARYEIELTTQDFSRLITFLSILEAEKQLKK